MDESGRLLEGIKVLDVASFIAAPVAATVMADFGAGVIKVEAPGGDGYRNLYQAPGMPPHEVDYAWLMDNRSKRGLCLDLNTDDGRAVLHKLIERSDVMIINFPPKVRRKLKLTYEDLAHINDRLIYASLSAYGEEGEDSERTGFDSTALWARTGLMDLVKTEPSAAPARSTPGMGDHPTGISLLAAVMMGLFRRERTGKGGHVSTSLLATGAWMNAFYAQAVLMGADIPVRPHRDEAPNPLANHYRCADDRWFILALLNEERQCAPFFQAIGRPELLEDSRFADAAARRANAQELTHALDAVFATQDWEFWRQRLEEEGITYGTVAKVTDIADDPQFRHAGAVVPMESAPGGYTIGSPLFVEGSEKRPPAPPPHVGEHTREILAELDYSPDQIEALIASRAAQES